MVAGLPSLGAVAVNAKEAPCPQLNDLESCPSLSPDWNERTLRQLDRYGDGDFDPHEGTSVLQALMIGYPYPSWGVTVYLTGESRAIVKLREDVVAGPSNSDADGPVKPPRGPVAEIPRALAVRINNLLRFHLSGAHVPLDSLPPPGTMPGFCHSYDYYKFIYRDACATNRACSRDENSVSNRMVALVDALRDVARSSNETRDAALEALVARVAALE
jgi:hypothetical protein